MTAKEPGWYPDPFTQGRYERYFTGTAWADETHPSGGPPVTEHSQVTPTPGDEEDRARSGARTLVFFGSLTLMLVLAYALWPVAWTGVSCGSVLVPSATTKHGVSVCVEALVRRQQLSVIFGVAGLLLIGLGAWRPAPPR